MANFIYRYFSLHRSRYQQFILLDYYFARQDIRLLYNRLNDCDRQLEKDSKYTVTLSKHINIIETRATEKWRKYLIIVTVPQSSITLLDTRATHSTRTITSDE